MRSEKLGSALRRLLGAGASAAAGGVAATASVEVLIRVAGEADDARRGRLASAGAKVRTVAGDILTADAATADIGRITDLDDVVYVELAQPLYPEPGK